MEKLMVFWLLFAGLNFALAADIPQYLMEGGKLTLELRPPSSEPISYILWKFEGNLLGEWVKDVVDLTYYNTFQGRTTLDTNTGRLEISNMTKADVGLYSVEINNKLQPDQYKAVLIKAVTQPKVWIAPLTCGSSESCTATCEANTTDAGPVTYSWKMGDGEWKESGKTIDITKADTADVKTFTCRVKNPLNEKESEPLVILFCQRNPPDSDLWIKILGAVMRSLAILALLGTVTYLVWWKRETVRKLLCPCLKGDDNAA
ncbi:uncharacterized protein LOC126406841 [Epinephelus moara]|uniref:uncharacterized protein LOC126406841 n=1 Tax=Epinephelus moara TaxID=300413 RepID=UPI00214E59FD|nr:uncharacterized protein LOC126406841 [Epinephelus moara]